ncbi:14650_t:CDS:1, partial [Dentiscutata erythropus]
VTPILSPDPDYIPTYDNLLNSLPLLLYSAMAIPGSYLSNNNRGRESFMLARRLYNGITNTKNISSKVIVFYRNENKHYDAVKNNFQKTVLSIIGRLKVSSNKTPHIIASEIEWIYVNEAQSSSTSNKSKSQSHEELDL